MTTRDTSRGFRASGPMSRLMIRAGGGRGRARFRYDDLCLTADLLMRLAPPPAGGRAHREC